MFNKNFKSKELALITFIVAYCSIVYEFALAQSLSSILGNSVLRYNLTIGLYVFSLGIGALVYKKFFSNRLSKKFIQIELSLSVVGGFSPILMLLLDKYLQNTSYFLLLILSHSFIVIIGVLSGFELPVLMDLSEEIKSKTSNHILSIDYLGTFIGIILFPFVLMPKFGIFQLTFLTALLNALVCMYTAFKQRHTPYIIMSAVLVITFIIFLIKGISLHKAIIENIYL
jgi:spermidine synthase